MDDLINVGGVRSRDQVINLGAYWKDVRKERNSDGLVIYKGCHYLDNAEESDPNWSIWKYVYADGLEVREVGPITGSWENRNALDFGSSQELSTSQDVSDSARTLDVCQQMLTELRKIEYHLMILSKEDLTNEEF